MLRLRAMFPFCLHEPPAAAAAVMTRLTDQTSVSIRLIGETTQREREKERERETERDRQVSVTAV